MATGTPETQPIADAVSLAYELGRLDFISALLAIVALVVAFGGLYAFINFRAIAKRQATEEASRVAQEVAERVANEYMARELPNISRAWQEFAEDTATDEQADEIAGAQDPVGDEQ